MSGQRPKCYGVFKQDKCPLLEFKTFVISLMFREFRCPEDTDKVLSMHYFSSDRPKITKWLTVDLS